MRGRLLLTCKTLSLQERIHPFRHLDPQSGEQQIKERFPHLRNRRMKRADKRPDRPIIIRTEVYQAFAHDQHISKVMRATDQARKKAAS